MKYYIKQISLNPTQLETIQKSIQLKLPFSLTLSIEQMNESSGDFQLPLTSLQVKKIETNLVLSEMTKLEFHLIQLKEVAMINYNQLVDIDMIAFKRN